jgi:LPXTG-motif cell wall-anchored protein
MVRSVGVASAAAALALGVAGNASACSINDFSFTGTASCDQQSGNGVITVHDTDGTRPVTITVQDDNGKQIAQQPFSDKSGDFAVSVPWVSGAHYQVLASVANYFQNKPVGSGVTLPSTDCGTKTPPSSPAVPPSSPAVPPSSPAVPPSSPAVAPSASPSAVASTSAAAVADTSSPSPSATGNLAETGGGSNTGMIAGIAAALVVVGGGAVFGLRRRSATARH